VRWKGVRQICVLPSDSSYMEFPGVTRYWTVEQVAEITGMSRKWLWAQCRTDAIAHHKFGNKYRFSDVNLADLGTRSAVVAVEASDEMVPLTRRSPRPKSEGHLRVGMVRTPQIGVVPDHTLENPRD
jgi:Helix-turn-helix domain